LGRLAKSLGFRGPQIVTKTSNNLMYAFDDNDEWKNAKNTSSVRCFYHVLKSFIDRKIQIAWNCFSTYYCRFFSQEKEDKLTEEQKVSLVVLFFFVVTQLSIFNFLNVSLTVHFHSFSKEFVGLG
jgi:hypothetical protein